MNNMKIISLIFISLLISAFSITKEINEENYKDVKQDNSSDLYNIIFQQDSIFFQAYNTCDLDKQSEYYSDNIEFYHDKGGLTTSKKEILEATKKNICGKVRRKLIKSSLEVYPINGYGAVEIGMHEFQNLQQNQESNPSKFIIIWQQDADKWKITRVISLH